MNRKKVLTLTLSCLLAFGATSPVYALFGSGHGDGHHGSSASHEDSADLGEKTVSGVKAAAQLVDVRVAMVEAGQPMTHHLQILFTNLETRETFSSGTVAVKVTTPRGKVLPAQALEGMDGHFGVDLTLADAGTYKLSVGTKLADGNKRQFEFTAVVK